MKRALALIGLAVGAGLLLVEHDVFAAALDEAPGDGPVLTPSGYPSWASYDALFQKYSGSVPWGWLKAVAIVESTLGQNKNVARGLASPENVMGSTSGDGLSWGLMQVTLKTARALDASVTTAQQLNDADTSVRLGGALLNQLRNTFGNDPESIFRAYNGGPHFGSATKIYWLKIKGALALVEQYNPGAIGQVDLS